jgi:hypothetical protein
MSAKIVCATCQKEYRWKPEIAGKRAKCKCGAVISIPAQEPVVPEEEDIGAYDLAEAPPEPVRPPVTVASAVGAPVATRTIPAGRGTAIGQIKPRTMFCDGCGAEAPTKYVTFHQNIGMLVARRHSTVEGKLCKNCIHSNYWKMTMTTLTVGWLGRLSFFIAPAFIVTNTVRYIGCLSLPKKFSDSELKANNFGR